jgi:cyclopropane-fatty-acyl-phospholipid synthase
MLFAGFMYWHSRHSQAGKHGDCTRFLRFNDPVAHKRYSGRRIDMETMYEMYFDGTVDFKVEKVDEFGLPLSCVEESPCLLRDVLAYRHEFVDYTFGLSTHLKFLLTRWVPDVLSHSRLQDTAQVRDHY